jgi:hypothetical protein
VYKIRFRVRILLEGVLQAATWINFSYDLLIKSLSFYKEVCKSKQKAFLSVQQIEYEYSADRWIFIAKSYIKGRTQIQDV